MHTEYISCLSHDAFVYWYGNFLQMVIIKTQKKFVIDSGVRDYTRLPGAIPFTWINFNPSMDTLITCPVMCGME